MFSFESLKSAGLFCNWQEEGESLLSARLLTKAGQARSAKVSKGFLGFGLTSFRALKARLAAKACKNL